MSLSFTPHWAFPAMFVLLSGFVAAFVAGCTAKIPDLSADDPAAEICGGSVCFAPTDVTVKHWGDGEVTIIAYRADDLSCAEPHTAAGNDAAMVSGRAIEVQLHHARLGDTVPIVDLEHAADAQGAYATVHAVRVEGGTGQAAADEQAVDGEAQVLDLDPNEGRVRVRVRARWSSGVTGELLVDVAGPHACAAE